MKKGIHILMVEDDIADAELTKHALRQGGLEFTFQRVDSREEFLREMGNTLPDVVLSDSALPSFDGKTALSLVQEGWPHIPFIFVTGTMGEEAAIETLKGGATDYVLKTHLSRLIPAVHRALREADERSERRRAEERLRDSHEQLRALSVYLQYVREEERTRIAREVHDELGQAMTSLKMDVAWLAGRLPKDAKLLQEKARAMATQLDSTIHTIRRISTELRPAILDDLGLVAAIEWQGSEFEIRTGIRCRVSASLGARILDQDLNTAFFRIFQEALTNVVRHAEATEVEVTLAEAAGSLTLEVRDNGRGIMPAEISSTKSIGLLGMRERAVLLGGTLEIQGRPGQGTTIIVRIPSRRPEAREINHHEDSNRRRPRHRAPGIEANSRG